MDEFRTAVKQQVVAAGRGPFGGWWEALLEIEPELLRRVHLHLEVAEDNGPIDERLRHLIWTAVDGVVTHLYPRGLGVHARISLELGASVTQVLDALRIAASVSGRGYGRALPILLDEVERAGAPGLQVADEARSVALRERLIRQFGADAPDWMLRDDELNPEGLEAFLDLWPDPDGHEGLDSRSCALVAVAAASCPAIADDELTRFHIRQALDLGVTAEELAQALRLANAIGLHSISEGVMQLQTLGVDIGSR